MGQIVKRKGRPSKADIARRSAAASELPAAADKYGRRSVRRRNVRYTLDLDDYIDDDFDDEDAWMREKKLKLLLKLESKEEGGSAESEPSRTRLDHAHAASGSSSEYDGNLLKKRKIDSGVAHYDAGNGEDDEEDDGEVRGRQAELKPPNSASGTPSDPHFGSALPDKMLLELILDKLQKKDIYGVYAEPVDPEELPDYHEVIEHPMDFATVRKKLRNGTYFTLEEFESDILLICTNAMQYNAPDTIYYKQACSIQELAQKKVQRLRIEAERFEAELKSEHVLRSDSLPKKPMSRTTQEPIGSDFSSGANLATPGDLQSGSNAMQAGGFERHSNTDGPVEGNDSLADNVLEKAEDLFSGRGLLSRLGRKPHVYDENRRATYNLSNQPVSRSESIFTTFDDDMKQLVPVGLNTDYSYSMSLARFAATLGPVAWDVASKRIEQGLPPGFKYGRGWVGDYEPLPTPLLILDTCTPKKLALRKDNKSSNSTPVSSQEHSVNDPALKKEDSSLFGAAAMTKTAIIPTASALVRGQSVREANLDRKQPFFCSGVSRGTATASVNYPQQSPRPRNIEPAKKIINQAELNCPSSPVNQNMHDGVAEEQTLNVNVAASRPTENVSRNSNLLQSEPSKQLENNGKFSCNGLDRNRMATSPSDGSPSAPYFSHGQEQGLSDPVQLMKMLVENSQKQQKSLNHSPVDNKSLVPSVSRSDDSINATAAAARAWMSVSSKAAVENTGSHKDQISAHSLYNSTREPHQQASQFCGDFPGFGMHFKSSKTSFPLQPRMTLPAQRGNEAQVQNQPVFFPQLAMSDLSRFQVHSPRQGSYQQRQIQESIPPDLNLSFQSSGSPVGLSTCVVVDSQQPDLALQL